MNEDEANRNMGLAEPLNGKTSSNDDISVYTDADESISAPVEILAEFLSFIMMKDYHSAMKYCKIILQYEPNHSTAKDFFPLLQEKCNQTRHEEESDDDDDTLGTSDDGNSDFSVDTDNSEDGGDSDKENRRGCLENNGTSVLEIDIEGMIPRLPSSSNGTLSDFEIRTETTTSYSSLDGAPEIQYDQINDMHLSNSSLAECTPSDFRQ